MLFLINSISTRSTPQILSLNDEERFLFLFFLIIGAWSSFASCWFCSISFLIPFLVDFYQKACKPSRLILFGNHQILDYLQFQKLYLLKLSFSQIFKFTISHIMLKTSFIKFMLVNIICISCQHKNLSLVLVNGPQALYVKPGCFKCISAINLSPANKNLLTISFLLYLKRKVT